MNPDYERETQRLVNEENEPEERNQIRINREEQRHEQRQTLRDKILAEEEAKVIRGQARRFRGALAGLGILMMLSCGMMYLRLRPQ